MNGFVDIHSHILPGLDDGSADMNETMKMLQLASEEGTGTICATPHYRPRHWKHSASEAEETLLRTIQMIFNKGIDIELFLGNEVYYSESCIASLLSGECKTLNRSRYVLIEFQPATDFPTIQRALYNTMAEGYIPLLAHVERYDNIFSDLGKVDRLIEQGVYIQVNAGSVTGASGRGMAAFTRKLLKHDMVHVIATDCHNVLHRPPLLKKCHKLISRKYSREYADLLMKGNPMSILRNDYI